MGIVLFREHILKFDIVKKKLLNTIKKTILPFINKERKGETINKTFIKNITNMLIDLSLNNDNLYEEYFENYFLKDSIIFYRSESQLFVQYNCFDYIKKVI